MRSSRNVWLALPLLAACAAPQKPVQFTAHVEDPVGVVTRTLAAEGQSIEQVDAGNGIVQTAWSDTGFGYGFIESGGESHAATIYRRYTVVLGKEGAVTVRADTQKCAVVPLAGRVCQELNTLVARHQEELDRLGATLQQAMK